MKSIALAALLLCLALCNCYADALPLDFVAVPQNITVAPGDTAGWGYSITNKTSSDYAEATVINADSFQHGTPDSFNFDFPVIGPGVDVSTPFSPFSSGLFEFTADMGAPLGFVNSGNFLLTVDWFSDSSLSAGSFLEEDTYSTPYSVTIGAVATPEPQEIVFVLPFLAYLAYRINKRSFVVR